MNTNSKKRRRQRAVLSCNDCRRRKLKCDRLAPCNRCIKGGIADTCAYGSEPHDTVPEDPHEFPTKSRKRQMSSIADPAEAMDSEINLGRDGNEKQDTAPADRLEKLERDIALLQQRVPSTVHEVKDQVEFLGSSPDLKVLSRSSAVMGMLKGRGYGTHFYGASSAMSIIAQFPDLRFFMNVAYGDSTARRLSQDMKASEDRARVLRQHHRVLSVDSLRSLLPDQPTVNTILKQYFDTFESTFRIIHVPTFEAAYESYWESQGLENTDMDALVLAILACTICTSSHTAPRYNHSGSTFHSKSIVWVRACESWLKRQSNKRRSLASLQVRCLRLLALATSSMKVKEYYQEVQAHVALMRSAGMHRDPSIFGTRCSVFEGEMRRRLWATTMELEIQASIDKGASSVLSGLEQDCAPPRNMNDSELSIDLTELPRSHGITTYTDSAYLHVASLSLKHRIGLSCKVNKLRSDTSLPDTLENEEALGHHLVKIPRWTDPRSMQATTLLELQLRQFVIILNTPRALRSNAQSRSDCRYSMITALEASAATIQLHASLLKHTNYALVLTRNDYFRAVLLICHAAYHAQRNNDTTMMRFAKQIFDDTYETALRLQEERAMRPGRGMEFFWYVSAAVSLVGIQFKTAKAGALKRQAVDRISKLLYRVLALQDEPTEETLATEVLLVDRPTLSTNADNGLSYASNSLPGQSFGDSGMQLDPLGLGDASEYMMDDLWFLDIPTLDNVPPLDFDI